MVNFETNTIISHFLHYCKIIKYINNNLIALFHYKSDRYMTVMLPKHYYFVASNNVLLVSKKKYSLRLLPTRSYCTYLSFSTFRTLQGYLVVMLMSC